MAHQLRKNVLCNDFYSFAAVTKSALKLGVAQTLSPVDLVQWDLKNGFYVNNITI